MMSQRALVAGASGVTGRYLAEHLVSIGWEVYGLARRPLKDIEGVRPVAADLLQPDTLAESIRGINPTHVFFTTWLKQPTEAENCKVNGALIDNLLVALEQNDIDHVGLVTGGKGYFGSYEELGKYAVTTPFREEQARKPGLNFYYTQEDILFDHARRKGFSWTVHRPCSSIIGYAPGNAMNMATTLAVYATLCKETGRPFVFPGSTLQHTCLAEVVDADIIARQIAWAATTPEAKNQAFNVGNGDFFRWDWMWEHIAEYFHLKTAPYPGHETPLVEQLKDAEPVWQDIVRKYGLRSHNLEELAPAWHTDADLCKPFESIADLSRSRSLGFTAFKKSTRSFFDVFDKLKAEKIIPDIQ